MNKEQIKAMMQAIVKELVGTGANKTLASRVWQASDYNIPALSPAAQCYVHRKIEALEDMIEFTFYTV